MLVYFIQETDEPDLQVIDTVEDNKHTFSVNNVPRSGKPSTTVYLIPDPDNFIRATTDSSNTNVWTVEPINVSLP